MTQVLHKLTGCQKYKNNAKLNGHWKIRSFKTKNLKIRFIKIKHCLQIIGKNKNHGRTNPSYKYIIDA